MKQIYCPKCRTGYEIDENLIPEDGKKAPLQLLQSGV